MLTEWRAFIRGQVAQRISVTHLNTLDSPAAPDPPDRFGTLRSTLRRVLTVAIVSCDATAPRARRQPGHLLIAGVQSVGVVVDQLVNSEGQRG